MIKKTILFALLMTATLSLQAQTPMRDVLAMVERNNSSLAALSRQSEADKLGNKTGIYLDAPEVGYNYLFGRPAETGNRHDISISQSFDMATLSGARNRAADAANALVDCSLRAERMSVLLEAKLCLVDIVYCNAALRSLGERLADASVLEEGAKRMLDAGEINLMDYNDARLTRMTAEADRMKMEADRQQALQELERLNGGKPVAFSGESYDAVVLDSDFTSWYASVSSHLPDMERALADIEVSRRQLSLAKAERMPDVSLGYMSEKTRDEHFQGLTIGVSLPLWSGRNKVRQARAAVIAAEAMREDKVVQLRSQLRKLHTRALLMRDIADTCKKAAGQFDRTLLRRALDAGELSRTDYLVQSAAYYDTVGKALEAEHEYQVLLAQLTAAEL